MKISNQQKIENRNRIISAAVDLMTENDFKSATMKAIARKAGLGDATIYNYFPTKESILYAYYEEHLKRCEKKLDTLDGFEGYSFQEQLQTFFELQFEEFLPEREFVQQSFNPVFFSFSQDYNKLKPVRDLFFALMDALFSRAIDNQEIPEQVFRDFIYYLLWDYYIAMVTYWINDRSDQFTDTTVFNDKSLDLICSLLRTNVMNKAFDIITFLFKTHVLSRMNHVDRFETAKRFFTEEVMGGKHG